MKVSELFAVLAACMPMLSVAAASQDKAIAPETAFDAPENALWHERSRSWFVSNLGGGVSLAKDGYGWITRLDENGRLLTPQWVKGLDAPTGMASVDHTLYVGDRGVVVVVDVPTAKIIRKIAIPDSEFINDVAAGPDGFLYVSDFFKNRIYRIDRQYRVEIFVASAELDFPNGLWVDGDKLYVGTWGAITDKATFATSRSGTLKVIDLNSRKISPIGSGAPIANFDGVIHYGNGAFATDWSGGRLLYISDLGEVSEVLTGFKHFADLGFDPKRQLFVIPEMSANRVIVLHGGQLMRNLK